MGAAYAGGTLLKARTTKTHASIIGQSRKT
jgi:hypothetical protein